MKLAPLVLMLCLPVLPAQAALAQSDAMAAERAKLANQRIRVEADQKAREEEERQRAAAEQALPQGEAVQSQQEPRSDPATLPAAPATADRTDMYRVLEQLRELGELRDAGYVTEEEFQELKQAIIGSVR